MAKQLMTCPYCFHTYFGGKNAHMCPECRKKRELEREKEFRAWLKEGMEKKPVAKPTISLTEMSVLAGKAGMTYGELEKVRTTDPERFEKIWREYD